MTAKKGRALALELMDDLLDEDTKDVQKIEEESSKADEKPSPKDEKKSSETAFEKASQSQADERAPSTSESAADDEATRYSSDPYTLELDDTDDSVDRNEKTSPYTKPLSEEPTPEELAASIEVSSSGADDLELDLSQAVGHEPADDQTYKLSESKIIGSTHPVQEGGKEPKGDETAVVNPNKQSSQASEDRVRASVGRFASLRSAGAMSPAEASLAQSENLRIAQDRILELEKEVERLRLENEELAAAGETLRRRADELWAKTESLESKYNEHRTASEEEKELLQNTIHDKEHRLEELRLKNEELEMRLSTNIQKIRVRERELENRLELVKMESAALIRNKDEIILDLKRQVDQLNLELDNYRHKGQELNKQLGEKQDMLRRTVKALRIALSMLEGSDDVPGNQKKVK